MGCDVVCSVWGVGWCGNHYSVCLSYVMEFLPLRGHTQCVGGLICCLPIINIHGYQHKHLLSPNT